MVVHFSFTVQTGAKLHTDLKISFTSKRSSSKLKLSMKETHVFYKKKKMCKGKVQNITGTVKSPALGEKKKNNWQVSKRKNTSVNTASE